jgi:hypothetical protein
MVAQKSRRDGRWYVANLRNWLLSPESGMTDAEALEFLTEQDLDQRYVAAMDAAYSA